MNVLIEAAVDTFHAAERAQAEGAKRIELCGPLHNGGTTPSAGLIARCCERLLVSVHVLIRPRVGDFVYTDDELAIMQKDVAVARELGADGVVTGALTRDGEVDVSHLAELIAVASPMRVGFHRAFDQIKDPEEAVEILVSMQVDHVLTSGGAKTAMESVDNLARLAERTRDRISIIAGGGVRADHVRELVERTGVTEVHARGTEAGTIAAIAKALAR